MLTADKINIYNMYGGWYDGFSIKNRPEEQIFENGEWALITSLLQDISLTRKGMTSKSYEDELDEKLRSYCDSPETINLLRTSEI